MSNNGVRYGSRREPEGTPFNPTVRDDSFDGGKKKVSRDHLIVRSECRLRKDRADGRALKKDGQASPKFDHRRIVAPVDLAGDPTKTRAAAAQHPASLDEERNGRGQKKKEENKPRWKFVVRAT